VRVHRFPKTFGSYSLAKVHLKSGWLYKIRVPVYGWVGAYLIALIIRINYFVVNHYRVFSFPRVWRAHLCFKSWWGLGGGRIIRRQHFAWANFAARVFGPAFLTGAGALNARDSPVDGSAGWSSFTPGGSLSPRIQRRGDSSSLVLPAGSIEYQCGTYTPV